MADLHLISLSRAEVVAADRAVRRGDADPLEAFGHLWDDYADQEIACFICNGICAKRPFAQILPDREKGKLLAAPLCDQCMALPSMVRLNRCFKLLKKMWPGFHMRGGAWGR